MGELISTGEVIRINDCGTVVQVVIKDGPKTYHLCGDGNLTRQAIDALDLKPGDLVEFLTEGWGDLQAIDKVED